MWKRVLYFSIGAFGVAFLVLATSPFAVSRTQSIHLFWRAFYSMPSRVSENWVAIILAVGIFCLAEFFVLVLRGRQEMKRQWGESLGIGIAAVIIGWVGLFVYSVVATVHEDHQSLVSRISFLKTENQKQLNNPTKPDLRGEIYQTIFSRSGDEDQDSLVIITAGIKNFGTSSIVEGIGLRLKLTNGKEIHLVDLPPPSKPLRLLLPNGRTAFDLDREGYLLVKAGERPIPLGGKATGWYWGVAKGIKREQTVQEGNIVILSFRDFTGKNQETIYSVNPKEGFEPPDLRKLQRPIRQ